MSSRRSYPADIQTEVAAANRGGRELNLTPEQLEELGHRKQPLTRAIRSFCLDCMGGNRAEVRRCTSVGLLRPQAFTCSAFATATSP